MSQSIKQINAQWARFAQDRNRITQELIEAEKLTLPRAQ